jgi:hypothetical protein
VEWVGGRWGAHQLALSVPKHAKLGIPSCVKYIVMYSDIRIGQKKTTWRQYACLLWKITNLARTQTTAIFVSAVVWLLRWAVRSVHLHTALQVNLKLLSDLEVRLWKGDSSLLYDVCWFLSFFMPVSSYTYCYNIAIPLCFWGGLYSIPTGI